MTTRYNSNHVDNSLVFFSKPEIKTGLKYYDFDTKSWRPVEVIANLPYALQSYRFLDEENPGDKDCVVTCKDSYRLKIVNEENYDSDDSEKSVTYDMWWESVRPDTDEEMENDRGWRDDLVKEGAEFEYVSLKNMDMVYGKVCWVKSDIIPGVLLCGHRKCPNINPFGYIYKESRRFFPIGTRLPPISDEQLEEEAKEKDNYETRKAEKEAIVKLYQKEIDYFTCKEHPDWPKLGGHPGIWNTLQVYDNFSKYPHEIKIEDVNKWNYDKWIANEKDPEEYKEVTQNPDNMAYTLLCLGSVSVASDYGVCYISHEQEIQKEWKCHPSVSYTTPEAEENAKNKFVPATILSGQFDIYFDIVVHGATRALMWCGDGSPQNNWNPEYNSGIPLVKEGELFTFPDVVYDNPLFRACMGSKFTIYTDGDKITYKGGWLQQKERMLMVDFKNGWTVNKLQGRYLMNGHMWTPSFSFPVEDLVMVDKPVEEKD